MQTNEDIQRRLARLEDHHEKLMNAIQEMAIANTKLSIIVESMNDYESRLKSLEESSYTSNTILTIIKWLAISVIGACITISISQLGEGIFNKLLN